MTDNIDEAIKARVTTIQTDIKALEELAKEHGKKFDLDIGLNFGATFEEIYVDEDYDVAHSFDRRYDDEELKPEWGWNAWLPSSAYC